MSRPKRSASQLLRDLKTKAQEQFGSIKIVDVQMSDPDTTARNSNGEILAIDLQEVIYSKDKNGNPQISYPLVIVYTIPAPQDEEYINATDEQRAELRFDVFEYYQTQLYKYIDWLRYGYEILNNQITIKNNISHSDSNTNKEWQLAATFTLTKEVTDLC
jgi:hypothetical protein